MMKKTGLIFLIILLGCSVSIASANGEGCFETIGQVHPSLPAWIIRVSNTGEYDKHLDRPLLLRVDIAAQDGRLAQTLFYRSSEDPASDHIVSMAQLQDMNFDGFSDLVLLTAQGASNVFVTIALWNEEAGQFHPIMQHSPWNPEKREVDRNRTVQLELCNVQLFPDLKTIISDENDGYRFTTECQYVWEGRYDLHLDGVFAVYDAGKDKIGEMLELYGTGIRRVWNDQYPESWYYEEDGQIQEERRSSAHKILMDNAIFDAPWMKVTNVDWVNLRQQDTKTSPSLARLTAGTQVQKLAEGIGTDAGWVRVLYRPENQSADYETYPDGSAVWLTGYIWHSFLEEMN